MKNMSAHSPCILYAEQVVMLSMLFFYRPSGPYSSLTVLSFCVTKLWPSYILECSHYSTLVQLPREPV